jgi:hypothetical protein
MIRSHIADYEADQDIDYPAPSIWQWPGKGNPYFEAWFGLPLPDLPGGLAPFHDRNGDGLYDPADGDYPEVPNLKAEHAEIAWCVFNDAAEPYFYTDSEPLGIEVQPLFYTLNCAGSPQLDKTIFASVKVINRSGGQIDSMFMSLYTEFDIGCIQDDAPGSVPELNTVYSYNALPVDTSLGYWYCGEDDPILGVNPPAQAMTLLNQDLHTYIPVYGPVAITDPPLGMLPPVNIEEYYLNMNGYWRDGTPLTKGGIGYNPGLELPQVSHALPDQPWDETGWSWLTSNESLYPHILACSSVYLGSLENNASQTIDLAYSYFREPGEDYLGNVSAMYEGIANLQQWYDNGFEEICPPPICDTDCVWPGDTNTDGMVDHRDLLALAGWQGTTGPERKGLFWGPHPAPPWAGVQATGRNQKHADTNGDGIINFEDLDIISFNKYLQQADYTIPPAQYPEGPEVTLVGLTNNNADTLSQFFFNNSIRINIEELPELMALAFTLEFAPGYFETINNWTYDDLNGIMTTDERAVFYVERLEDGEIDIALARTADDPSFGQNELTLILNPGPFHELPGNQVTFRLKNLIGIRSDGAPFLLGGNSRTFYVPDIPVAATEPLGAPFHLFPNPTTGQLHVQFPGQQVEQLEVWNSTGQLVHRAQGPFTEQYTLDLSGLPPGLYTVRARLETGIKVEKVVVH